MKYIIDGKAYNTETSTELANNEFSDGTNRMSHGRSTTLYRTKKGAYWVLCLTQWQGERDNAEAIDKSEAKELYERLDPVRGMTWEDAFNEELPEA